MFENDVTSLGLNKAPKTQPLPVSPSEPLPDPGDLQFQRAEPLEVQSPGTTTCVACKRTITDQYYRAGGKVVCPSCAEGIRAARQAPKFPALARAVAYGAGAAIAGSALYSVVSIVIGYQLALVAIVVGVMVGKSMRHASRGLGGRSLQFLAVGLTYLAITSSYATMALYDFAKDPKTAAKTASAQSLTTPVVAGDSKKSVKPIPTVGNLFLAIISLVGISLALPFLALSAGFNGVITVLIMFFGMQRAWKLTGGIELLITGPYGPASNP